LNRRPKIAQYAAGLGGYPLKLSAAQLSRTWNFAFDDILWHDRLLVAVAMDFTSRRCNQCGS
jgi:hypothetical protein